MRQRSFGELAREVGLLGGPIAEARPEAVHRVAVAVHAAQQLQHRHVGQALALDARRRTGAGCRPRAAATVRISSVRSDSGTRWSRPAFMRPRRDRPDLRGEVDLGPDGVDRLAGPHGAEDGELKRPGADAGLRAQPRHEAGNVPIGHGRLMAHLAHLAFSSAAAGRDGRASGPGCRRRGSRAPSPNRGSSRSARAPGSRSRACRARSARGSSSRARRRPPGPAGRRSPDRRRWRACCATAAGASGCARSISCASMYASPHSRKVIMLAWAAMRPARARRLCSVGSMPARTCSRTSLARSRAIPSVTDG